MIMPDPMCVKCKNYIFPENGKISWPVCRAFPNGIPRKIYFEFYDHTKPFDGDNGIRFESLDNKNDLSEEDTQKTE